MGQVSSRLTIFEGPDGAGKTTAAQAYAEKTGARYVHLASLPRVNKGLARIYVEAMLPALLGYQGVVLDRCWLSEMPYGVAFRAGADRLTLASRRMLERLALRCGAVVVRCQPPWEVVKANYLARKHLEMLENDQQLKQVYDLYRRQPTGLPELSYDYTQGEPLIVDPHRHTPHPLGWASAGNLEAGTILVGEKFAEPKDVDPLYQWPFASFSSEGCSQWLTDQLDLAGIREQNLCWINADQNVEWLAELRGVKIIALGDVAYSTLSRLKISATQVVHPQAWKRFNHASPYPLIQAIKGG